MTRSLVQRTIRDVQPNTMDQKTKNECALAQQRITSFSHSLTLSLFGKKDIRCSMSLDHDDEHFLTTGTTMTSAKPDSVQWIPRFQRRLTRGIHLPWILLSSLFLVVSKESSTWNVMAQSTTIDITNSAFESNDTNTNTTTNNNNGNNNTNTNNTNTNKTNNNNNKNKNKNSDDNNNNNDERKRQSDPSQEDSVSDGLLIISFSTWRQDDSPPDLTDEMIKEKVLQALQDFFCDDTELVVVSKTYKNTCTNGDGDGELISFGNTSTNITRSRTSISNFLTESGEEKSYIFNDMVGLVSTSMQKADGQGGENTPVQWTTWNIVYNVVYIGRIISQQAAMMNVTDEEDFMEDVTQLALDVSIMEGIMDTRMEGTGVRMSMVGLEVQTFQDDRDVARSNSDLNERDFQVRSDMLRWVGGGLLVVNILVVLLLTQLARRQRQLREEERFLLGKEDSTNKSRGLRTETDVNTMLDISRNKTSHRFAEQSSEPNMDCVELRKMSHPVSN
jgi:hypothetical protein